MTHLTFCTKDIPVTVNYLCDYLGFEQSKELHTKITDMRCFWGATIYDDTDKMNIDVKHNRTTFYINNGSTIHSRQFGTTCDSGGLGRRGLAGSTARGRHNAGASSRGPQGP